LHCGDILHFDADVINPSVTIDPSATLNPHLWIVITEPEPPGYECVIVNVTTQRKNSDSTVVLRRKDHPSIDHDSVVRFSDARIVDSRDLDGVFKAGRASARATCSLAVLQRIQQGVIDSIFSPKKIVSFCTERWRKK
jgi:hypothetical protein